MEDDIRYKQKCKDLRKRIREIEQYNETMAVRMERTKRAIQRLRLERAILQQQLQERTNITVDDTEGSPSPPASPINHGLLKSKLEALHESEKSKKKGSKEKSGGGGKRGQNAYQLFCEQEKENVKAKFEEENPGQPFDATKAMSAAWKALDESERQPYYNSVELNKKASAGDNGAADTNKATAAEDIVKPEDDDMDVTMGTEDEH